MNGIKLFIVLLTMVSIKVYSQENGINMLQIGFVKPLNYVINGIEQMEYIQSMEIQLLENETYQIKIGFNHTEENAYWMFKLTNWNHNGRIIKTKLVDISVEDTGGIWHIDENASGDMEINLETNIIKVEIAIHINNSSKTIYKIIWDNNIE
jgi:hypothetical protein